MKYCQCNLLFKVPKTDEDVDVGPVVGWTDPRLSPICVAGPGFMSSRRRAGGGQVIENNYP